jgi:heptosyltransferase-3
VTQTFKRILIVRTDRIGDVILTLPMAEVLKQNFPHVHLTLLVRRSTAELVEGNRFVDQILFYDDGKNFVPFFHLLTLLRRQRFDVVIHTYPRIRLALITWLANIPLRVGTGYRWYSFLFNKKVYEHRKYAERHELDFNCNLLKVLGCNVDEYRAPHLDVQPLALDKVRTMIGEMGIPTNCRLVILHPGSGGSARDWSPEKFGALARKLSELPNVKVLLTGGNAENNLVAKVQLAAGVPLYSMVNALSLKEYAALASLASLFVGNSTGPLHIAAAVGTPVIGLYPQIPALSARRWGPVTEKKAVFTPKNKPPDCRRCDGVKGSVCECMETISVEEVFDAGKRLLEMNQVKYIDEKFSRV